MSPIQTKRSVLSGWGRVPVVESRIARPEKRSSLQELVGSSKTNLLARGAGRSYGDAALNRDGTTLLTERFDRMISFDSKTGLLRAEAGIRLREVLQVFIPRGWFLPVTPGTKEVTLGGAIAFDVHGKNHHCDGGISNFIREISLLIASGEEIICSPERHSELFWATVSGGGLTGIITEVVIELRRIETAYVSTRRVKAENLSEAFRLFEEHESDHRYAVAWIDCLAKGSSLGRSVLTFGDHASTAELTINDKTDPLAYTPDRLFDIPFNLPSGLLNEWSVGVFNSFLYRHQLRKEVEDVEEIDPFFYPLDAIGSWNRMYGTNGFVQYQCVLPMDKSYEGLVELLQRFSEKGQASFLAVLKRMGPADGGFLSFPMYGYTLALDIPWQPDLDSFLSELDQIVLEYGGRVYLAKDAVLKAKAFREMYPSYDQWLKVKRRVDPNGRFCSSQARRLELCS